MAETTTAPADTTAADASSTPKAKAKPAEPRRAKVAEMLVLTVEPESNNGHDTAPALVTSVDDDGLVHVLVFRETAATPQRYGGLAVFADRDTVDALSANDRPAYAAYFG
jgi:hypothetical protein